MNSYVFTYHGNQVQAIHRTMADFVSLSEALASVGFRCIGLPWSTDSNPKMTGLMKTGLGFKLSIMFIKRLPYDYCWFKSYYCFRCLSIQTNK